MKLKGGLMPFVEASKKMENYSNKRTGKIGLVFYISSLIVTLFVLWGAISPSSLNLAAKNSLNWMIEHFGWFYMLITALFIVIAISLALSPYGKIRIGKKDDTPDYSWFSWISMLFAAGIGVGFVFWGVAEPVLYYFDPPEGYISGTKEAAIAGLRYGAYHWSLHPWSIYAIIGMALAYVQFRKGMPALISSVFYPLLGEKINGPLGKTIDILAIIATCTGIATTFGLSAMQITGGLSHIFSSIPNSALVQLIVIAIVTVLFLISAGRGVDKGIKVLSNINLVIAGILLLFVIFFGPTLFIAESFVTTLGGYIANVIPMALTLTPFSESDWLGTNTIFFWAWHISWAPYMGLFIARISRGRTIREFVAGVLIVPSLLAILWFSTFGGTALYIELFGAGGFAELINTNVELALFAMLAELPLSEIMNIVSIILISIFFITSADSASFVLGSMSTHGDIDPKLSAKIIWGLLIAGSASVLLVSSSGGLGALQTASIVAALPFTFIMIFLIISIMMILSKDWKADRKEEKMVEVAKVKDEVREEFKDDLKEDVVEEVKTEFQSQFKEELKDDVYKDVTSEIREGIKDDVYEEVKLEVRDEIRSDIKTDVFQEVKTEFRDEVQEEIKEHVYEEVKFEFLRELMSDMKEDVKKELYEEFKEKMFNEIKKEFIDSITEEVHKEINEKLTKHYSRQVQFEIADEMNEHSKK